MKKQDQIKVRMEHELYLALQSYANANKQSISEVIRVAIQARVKAYMVTDIIYRRTSVPQSDGPSYAPLDD